VEAEVEPTRIALEPEEVEKVQAEHVEPLQQLEAWERQ